MPTREIFSGARASPDRALRGALASGRHLSRIFHTWKGPGPPTQLGTARCAVPAACSGGTVCVVPGSVAMPRGEASAPERPGGFGIIPARWCVGGRCGRQSRSPGEHGFSIRSVWTKPIRGRVLPNAPAPLAQWLLKIGKRPSFMAFNDPTHAGRTRGAALCLFFSGLCALIYQTTWLREFRLIFGSSTPASAAVLGIFMAGVGAGSLVLGKKVDRLGNPFLFYGQLEAFIALSAAVTPALIWLVHAVGIGKSAQIFQNFKVASLRRNVAFQLDSGECLGDRQNF